ncbi:MAG: putative aldouronate transport system permease protein [Clostridiales bacterium]|jgi:putative aldouronate transport system permease protein|nr:putative aldouronate transport system permease protein [Clostridiales bacterium]
MVKKDKGFQISANIIMMLLSLICLIPFILMFVSSVTDENVLLQNGYSFFPEKLSLDTYRFLFNSSGSNIWNAYGITVVVTVIGTVANLTLTTLLSYPLSRKDLPHRRVFSFIVFFTMLFNGGLVPSYIMWTRYIGIKNTLAALIVPALMMNAFFVMIMRAFFQNSIPDSVIEAARIDGAGEWRVLRVIVLPMAKPMVATLTIMVGLMYWNDWMNGLYYVNKDSLYSIQVLLNRMLMDVQYLMTNANMSASDIGGNLPAVGIRMGVAVIGALPIMVVYPFFQRFFVKGIAIGAVKG